jgi:hypothetical protein
VQVDPSRGVALKVRPTLSSIGIECPGPLKVDDLVLTTAQTVIVFVFLAFDWKGRIGLSTLVSH